MRKNHRKKFTIAEDDFIKNNYGDIRYNEIGEKLGRSSDSIKRRARIILKEKMQEPGKNSFSRRKIIYTCDENFFSNINLVSTYWAGFIAADGCIIDKGKGKSKCLRIMLAIKDINHLKKFVNDVKFNGKIFIIKIKYEYNGAKSIKEQCYIDLRSNKICDSLKSIYNIMPRKSLTYNLKEVNFNFYAFLRGYIDGDGSVEKFHENKYWRARLSILGTYDFLNLIIEYFKKDVSFSEKCLSKMGNIYELVITGNKAIKIYQKLLNLDVPILGRKWDHVRDGCNKYEDQRIKFTDTQLIDIIKKLNIGYKQKEIAKEYNVHQVTISNIKLGKYIRQNKVLEGISKDNGVVDMEEVESLGEINGY